MTRHGVYPGSFDPLTVAHLAVADAARARCDLDTIDLVISHVALGKEHRDQTSVEDRLAELEASTSGRPWLQVRSTDAQLLVDIAEGHDVVVVGADKWHQLHDPAFYGSADAMEDALRRLPMVAVAPRAGHPLPDPDQISSPDVVLLDVDPDHHHVSSTAVRRGRDEWRA